MSQVKETLNEFVDGMKSTAKKIQDVVGAATDRATSARENLQNKTTGKEEEVFDAKKDHERLERGIADHPEASAVNLNKATIKEASETGKIDLD